MAASEGMLLSIQSIEQNWNDETIILRYLFGISTRASLENAGAM